MNGISQWVVEELSLLKYLPLEQTAKAASKHYALSTNSSSTAGKILGKQSHCSPPISRCCQMSSLQVEDYVNKTRHLS